MPTPHLVGPLPGTTPAELRSSRGHQRALPPDLLREASLRLGIISLLGAALWTFGTLLGHVALRAASAPDDRRWLSIVMPTDAIAAVSVAASLAFYFYSRRSRREPAFVLDLGLWYMVLMALDLGLLSHLGLLGAMGREAAAIQPVLPEVSWIGALVLMFAAIIPTAPRKMLAAALVAAFMNPIAMWIAEARGEADFGPLTSALLMHYPDFLLVGVAVVISHVVTRLGQQVAKAREMGSYQLGELLGRGGMGEIYRATHRMLARPAAIKLIRPEMLGGSGVDEAQLAVKRFCREAEAAASLRSPHTVEIYDFGVTADQTLYFVMELLDGLDLETLVRVHGPLPAGRVGYVLRQVCESLEEAHARGMVHRDIKPANIHLGRVGLHEDFVKVLDFGLVKTIAKSGATRGDGHSLATAAGFTPGTPAYMAPEMALDEAVDARADIYAVGCVAYYLLTGRLVFEADTLFHMVAMHMQSVPVPPSRRTEFPVPAALDEVVLACLAKAPRDRPQSAAELSRRLAAVDVEPWGEDQAAQWWQRVRASAAAERSEPGPASPDLTHIVGVPQHQA